MGSVWETPGHQYRGHGKCRGFSMETSTHSIASTWLDKLWLKGLRRWKLGKAPFRKLANQQIDESLWYLLVRIKLWIRRQNKTTSNRKRNTYTWNEGMKSLGEHSQEVNPLSRHGTCEKAWESDGPRSRCSWGSHMKAQKVVVFICIFF